MKNTNFGSSILAVLTSVSALVLTGCGKQTFDTVSSVSQSQAPGFFEIAPKVDIVLAQDNTGSMHEIYNDIGAQMPGFLDGLASSGWDYHFVSMPLTSDTMDQRLFNQVLASRQDRNWGASEWQAPFPGALFTDAESGQVSASFFRRPVDYTDFRYNLFPSNQLGGAEPGMETIRRQLKHQMGPSNFHRQDALLVVIVVGNGDDTSGQKICRRWDDYEAPCEQSGMGGAEPVRCGSPDLSLANNCSPGALASNPAGLAPGSAAYAREFYKQQLQGLRSSPNQVKLYAAVSGNTGSANCYGRPSFRGVQYMNVASATGGSSHDICASGAASVLSSIRSSLTAQKMALRTVYLMLDGEPDESSIRVVRYVGGDRNRPVEVSKSDTNGWSYAGMITNQPRVVTDGPNPVTLNTATGWAVKLNGSARLSGADTAEVVFLPRTQ